MSTKRTRASEDGNPDESPMRKQSKGGGASDQRKATFKTFLRALNEQFLSWIQEQLSEHPEELWSDGVRDYLDHADQILKDFHDVLSEKPAHSGPPKSVSFGSATTIGIGGTPLFGAGGLDKPFGTPTQAGDGQSKPGGAFSFAGATPPPSSGLFGSTTTSSNPFAFGGASSTPSASAASSSPSATASGSNSSPAAQSAPSGSIFGSAASSGPSSLFSFPSSSGAAGSSGSVPSTGAFGQSSIFGGPSAFGTGGFSFGGAAAGSSTSTANTQGGGNEEEEEEQPQKYESEVVTNDETSMILYKTKAKMSHYKKDTPDGKPSWDTKGVGILLLRAPKDNEKKPFVTFTTEAGRVLYIANLFKTMSTISNDGQNSLCFSAPWAPTPDQPPSLQMVRFQLAKGKNKELKAEIEKAQEKMD